MSDILALIGRADICDDWVSWQKDDPLFMLQQTGDNHPYAEQLDEIPPPYTNPPVINRSQYQAVIQRFNQASKYASNFASWTDT